MPSSPTSSHVLFPRTDEARGSSDESARVATEDSRLDSDRRGSPPKSSPKPPGHRRRRDGPQNTAVLAVPGRARAGRRRGRRDADGRRTRLDDVRARIRETKTRKTRYARVGAETRLVELTNVARRPSASRRAGETPPGVRRRNRSGVCFKRSVTSRLSRSLKHTARSPPRRATRRSWSAGHRRRSGGAAGGPGQRPPRRRWTRSSRRVRAATRRRRRRTRRARHERAKR